MCVSISIAEFSFSCFMLVFLRFQQISFQTDLEQCVCFHNGLMDMCILRADVSGLLLFFF